MPGFLCTHSTCRFMSVSRVKTMLQVSSVQGKWPRLDPHAVLDLRLLPRLRAFADPPGPRFPLVVTAFSVSSGPASTRACFGQGSYPSSSSSEPSSSMGRSSSLPCVSPVHCLPPVGSVAEESMEEGSRVRLRRPRRLHPGRGCNRVVVNFLTTARFALRLGNGKIARVDELAASRWGVLGGRQRLRFD